jgi:septal ring factor EnvC (AmiA/AmiB activator)
MEPENLTIRILMEIRDELRGTNKRIDQTNERLDRSNERLGAVEHAVRDMATQLVFMGRSLGVTRTKNRRHNVRLDDLERRVDALEKQRT